MMRTIVNKLSLALFALLLFTSCDNEEYGQQENMGGGSEKIHFDIVVATATTISSEVQTRVATSTDGNYSSTWNNGDAIGVYIVKGSGGLQPSGNWVDNMKMTYNNGSWTPTFPSGKEYYPTDGDKLSFYAYYPYNPAVTDALNMNITELTDQSSAANLSKSDLLSAATPDVGKGNTSVQLNFSHALTLVELSVTGSAGAEISSAVDVTLEGCRPDVSFNLSTGAAGVLGGVSAPVKSIKMYRVEQLGDADYFTKYTYRALVPTQTLFAGTELFRFSRKQGTITRSLSHTLASSIALFPEEVRPYDITLQPSIDPTHVYAVGDYYPYKGFPIQGVVFETSNGGKNGKIVDLDFIQRFAPVPGNASAPIRWGDPAVDEQAAGVVGIRDWNDGYNGTRNLINKYKDDGTKLADIYCIFNWIYLTKNNGNANGMWYIPAVNEVIKVVASSSVLNPKILETGGTAIEAMLYLSSTEKDATMAYSGQNYAQAYYLKDAARWDISIRAVGKF